MYSNYHTLCIDIGGTTTRLGIFELGGTDNTILWESQTPTSDEYNILLKYLLNISTIVNKYNIYKIGISVGVQLSPNGEVIIASNKLPDYVNRNLCNDVERIFSIKPKIAHDCICAVIAESMEINNNDNIAYITVSTGIGCAVLLMNYNNKIAFRSRIAHHIIDGNGNICYCGQKGCLASYTDSIQLKKTIKTSINNVDNINFWPKYTRMLAVGLVNISWILPIKKIVIGGGIALNQNYLQKNLKVYFHDIRKKGNFNDCDIEFSILHDKASLIGANLLANNNFSIIY